MALSKEICKQCKCKYPVQFSTSAESYWAMYCKHRVDFHEILYYVNALDEPIQKESIKDFETNCIDSIMTEVPERCPYSLEHLYANRNL